MNSEWMNCRLANRSRLRVTLLGVGCVWVGYVLLAAQLVGVWSPAALADQAEGVDCEIAKSAITSASRIRGLAIKKPVPCKLQDEEQVERYLRSAIEEKVPRTKIDLEGRAYQLIGVIPVTFDYFNGMIELYTSQLGGYYDPEEDYYAMASWMPAIMQMPIAVHELTHALQDQHFELDKMMDHKTATSDALMARSALVEGDATAVMLDFQRSMLGQLPIAETPSVAEIMMQNIGGAMFSPGLHKAPSALQAMLIFPYVSGLRFAHTLLQDGAYGSIDRALRKPPTSTEQILHPEKYLSKEGFTDSDGEIDQLRALLTSLEIPLSADAPLHTDRYGEFFIATILGTWIPANVASQAAAGWDGDRVVVFARDDGKQALAWRLHWDTDADAAEFLKALVAGYEKRFAAKALESERSHRFSQTVVGDVTILAEGKHVTLAISGGA